MENEEFITEMPKDYFKKLEALAANANKKGIDIHSIIYPYPVTLMQAFILADKETRNSELGRVAVSHLIKNLMEFLDLLDDVKFKSPRTKRHGKEKGS